MLRGCRGIVIAAFGWLALTGQNQATPDGPKAQKAAVEQQSAPDPSIAANTIAGAIRETIRPAEKDAGCDNGPEDRQSDLCAQWKAADAARDAANYALWSLLASAIATSLLIWTLWETRANARRELRAYVSFKLGPVEARVTNDGIEFNYQAEMINGGSTPAYECVHFGCVSAYSEEFALRRLSSAIGIEKDSLKGGTVVHGGEALPVTLNEPAKLPRQAVIGALEGKYSFFLYGTISYIDTFGIRRRTDYCFRMSSENFQRHYHTATPESPSSQEAIWKVAPFNNTAT